VPFKYNLNARGLWHKREREREMAELHIVGEIVGAVGFEDKNLFCKVRQCTAPPLPVTRHTHTARFILSLKQHFQTAQTKNKCQHNFNRTPRHLTPLTPHHPLLLPLLPHQQWGVEAGSMWDLVEGDNGGQTHCDYPPEGEPGVVWSHPVAGPYTGYSFSLTLSRLSQNPPWNPLKLSRFITQRCSSQAEVKLKK